MQRIDDETNKSPGEASIAVEASKTDIDLKNQIPLCCCINCCCKCGRSFAAFKESLPKDIQNPHNHSNKMTTDDHETRNAHNSEAKGKTNGHQKTNAKQVNQAKNKSEKQARTRMCMITGGVELVPLLARRRALQRPISLSTTDVTKCPNANK